MENAKVCVVFVFCSIEKHIDISPDNNTLHDDNYLNYVLKVTYTLFWWHFCHSLPVDDIFSFQNYFMKISSMDDTPQSRSSSGMTR